MKKPSIKNKAIIACAGSGKTTSIVSEASSVKNGRVLVTTYTNENLDQIHRSFIEKTKSIPSNVSVASWFVFLLQDGVRPYQNYLLSNARVRSIFFQTESNPFHKKDDYLTSLGDIYSNKVSEFIFECNKASGGRIIKRLEKIYDYIFIDELQDFAGYDLNFLEEILRSSVKVIAVGDPRQATFTTNKASKNRKYRGNKIYDWLKEREAVGEVVLEDQSNCYRCNQDICDFADALYPDLPKTTSLNKEETGHDGIFLIKTSEVSQYFKGHNPVILRYSKATNTFGLRAMNIGISKGRTFDRVLIFPTANMIKYLKSRNPEEAGDLPKLYVAVTRARFSVAFVVPDNYQIPPPF